ncbi:hypothetical protein D3C81_1259720 [compost metagenome]
MLYHYYPQTGLAFVQTAKRIQNFRNRLVHGIDTPTQESVKAASEELRELTKQLKSLVESHHPKKANGQEAG